MKIRNETYFCRNMHTKSCIVLSHVHDRIKIFALYFEKKLKINENNYKMKVRELELQKLTLTKSIEPNE